MGPYHLLHYLGKQETQKLNVFTLALHAGLPTNTQNTFKLSPGHFVPILHFTRYNDWFCEVLWPFICSV